MAKQPVSSSLSVSNSSNSGSSSSSATSYSSDSSTNSGGTQSATNSTGGTQSATNSTGGTQSFPNSGNSGATSTNSAASSGGATSTTSYSNSEATSTTSYSNSEATSTTSYSNSEATSTNSYSDSAGTDPGQPTWNNFDFTLKNFGGSAMSVRFIAEGNRFDFTAPSAITAGDVVTFGTIVGVCTRDFATGAKASAAINGIFEFPKVTSEFLQGEKVYWDGAQMTDSQPTNTDVPVGIVAQEAASGDAVARILLVPGLTA